MSLIIVSGVPRSGLALMCRILDDSGVEVVSDDTLTYGYSETAKLREGDSAWMRDIPDECAVKVFYPWIMKVPVTRKLEIIWMRRNSRNCAKSQRAFGGKSRWWIAKATKEIARINKSVPDLLRVVHPRVTEISFDELIRKPNDALWLLEEILNTPLVTKSVKTLGESINHATT